MYIVMKKEEIHTADGAVFMKPFFFAGFRDFGIGNTPYFDRREDATRFKTMREAETIAKRYNAHVIKESE